MTPGFVAALEDLADDRYLAVRGPGLELLGWGSGSAGEVAFSSDTFISFPGVQAPRGLHRLPHSE